LSDERYRSSTENSSSFIATAQALGQTEKLASIGQVIAGVAHELNNPLSAILLFAEDLLQIDRPADEAEALTIIVQQARRSRAIVRDLLSFVRSREATRVPVCPATLFDQISRTLRPQTDELGVVLHAEVSAVELIHVDSAGIEQVVTNLVMNASQATGAGGNVWMRCYAEATGYVIEIVDDGPGLSAEVQTRMFEPFFTTKPMGHGTGLGLSVSVGIVERHGGTISAENRDPRDGSGARFIVWLPTPAKAHAGPASGESGDSILVA
jgi:two-component system NtrC family sensor kinase